MLSGRGELFVRPLPGEIEHILEKVIPYNVVIGQNA
jgi:hypothetical protein